MDKKSVSEIRKIVGAKDCRIDRIRGCYVDQDGEILSEIKDSFLSLPKEAMEKYCEIFRKTLTGKVGKNLFNLDFPTEEVLPGGRAALLLKINKSELKDEEAIQEFFSKIREKYMTGGRYLILLAHGVYDIPARTSDGFDLEDASDNVYSFILCSICPVSLMKEGLCYDTEAGTFVDRSSDWAVQKPDLGFLYPAFNDRNTDVNQTLYFARKEDERHTEISEDVLGCSLPLPESDQKEVFKQLLEETLGRDCDFDTVKKVNGAINRIVYENEDNEEPVTLEKEQMRRVLSDSGVAQEAVERLETVFDEAVRNTPIIAENVANTSKLEIQSPSMKIQIKADMTDMIRTEIIDGVEYLVVPVVSDIEVNGVRILSKRRDTETETATEE